MDQRIQWFESSQKVTLLAHQTLLKFDSPRLRNWVSFKDFVQPGIRNKCQRQMGQRLQDIYKAKLKAPPLEAPEWNIWLNYLDNPLLWLVKSDLEAS